MLVQSGVKCSAVKKKVYLWKMREGGDSESFCNSCFVLLFTACLPFPPLSPASQCHRDTRSQKGAVNEGRQGREQRGRRRRRRLGDDEERKKASQKDLLGRVGWGAGEGAEGVCSSKTRIHPLPQTDDLLQFSNKVHSFFCSVRKRQRHLDRSGLTEAAHGSPAAHGKSLVAIWNNRW